LKHLQAVPGRDVGDFVAQNDRQFGFVLDLGKYPPRDKDKSARDGKRIEEIRVYYGEVILQLRPVRGLGDPLADLVQINLPIEVFVDSIFLDDLLLGLFADFDFGFLRDELHLAAFGNKISGARGQAHDEKG